MLRCVSVCFEQAPLALREEFAFPPHARRELYARLKTMGGGVLIVTCNRTELYAFCSFAAAEGLLRSVGAHGEASVPMFRAEGEAAVRRLFRLAAGLQSMLIGEDEILHQLKNAYAEARAAGATHGCDALFQAAIACGRRVRAETKIGEYACSVATIAANEVTHFLHGRGCVLLVGGTGMVGGAVLKNLLAAGHGVVATERSHAFGAAAEGARRIAYADRFAALAAVDAVVSCTSSPHVVFDAASVAAVAGRRARLFLDLAVPPDIERGVGAIEGCVLTNIDDLRAAAQENNEKKKEAAEAARAVAERCLCEFAAADAARRHAALLRENGELRRLRKRDPAAFAAALLFEPTLQEEICSVFR